MADFINVYESDNFKELSDYIPIALQKKRILYDERTGKFIIQFKLTNTGSSIVKKVFLQINLLDQNGKQIKRINEYVIIASAGKDVSFGDNSPIYETDKRIAGFEIIILKAVFDDGTIIGSEELKKRDEQVKKYCIYAVILVFLAVLARLSVPLLCDLFHLV